MKSQSQVLGAKISPSFEETVQPKTFFSVRDRWWDLCWLVKTGRWAAAAAKSLQLCPTLCDPIDGSPPGSPIPGILQARTLEWVAISFSSAWKWKVKVKSLNHVWLLAIPWTAAYQAPPSMGFSRQEYWSRVPLPSPAVGLVISKLRKTSSPSLTPKLFYCNGLFSHLISLEIWC